VYTSVIIVGTIVLASCCLIIFGRQDAPASTQADSEAFLLPRNTLKSRPIVSLLLSSSFGANALLYAAWLGYSIGVWAFLIQLAWSISFLLLSPYASKMRLMNSLHGLLGTRFGTSTRLVASLCTLAGFTYLIGWEFAIGSSSTLTLLAAHGMSASISAHLATGIIVGEVLIGTLLYTLWRGMRGNAVVDQFLNLIKLILIFGLTAVLIRALATQPRPDLWHAIFPPFATVVQNLGLWGFITNIVFNLAWQFVDNSSWQSIIAGADPTTSRSAANLRLSGLVIFLSIGTMGTLLGIALSHLPNVTTDNILSQAVTLLPQHTMGATIAMVVLIACCMMSLMDVLFVASTFTLLMDIFPGLRAVSRRPDPPQPSLKVARIVLFCLALAATWGVHLLFAAVHANLFDFVYIVIITQLSLIGPVIVALTAKRQEAASMWVPICFALAVGFTCSIAGSLTQRDILINGAGSFTVATSLILAFVYHFLVQERVDEKVKRSPGSID
jgi:hypothetical protein